MPARATGNDFHIAEIAKLLLADVHFVKEDLPGFLRNSSQQSVAHGAWLLENLLLHEMLETALLGHDRVPGNVLRRAADGAAFEIEQFDSLRRENGHFAVAEEEDAARVGENRRTVARDEEFLVSQADHNRRPQASGDN